MLLTLQTLLVGEMSSRSGGGGEELERLGRSMGDDDSFRTGLFCSGSLDSGASGAEIFSQLRIVSTDALRFVSRGKDSNGSTRRLRRGRRGVNTTGVLWLKEDCFGTMALMEIL